MIHSIVGHITASKCSIPYIVTVISTQTCYDAYKPFILQQSNNISKKKYVPLFLTPNSLQQEKNVK